MSLLTLVHAATVVCPPDFGAAPSEIAVRNGGRSLALCGGDGGDIVTPAKDLRLSCRCAWCTRARIDGQFPAAFEAIAITKVELIGGYALRLSFSDGHDRGVFPWSFIRDIATGMAQQHLEPSHA